MGESATIEPKPGFGPVEEKLRVRHKQPTRGRWTYDSYLPPGPYFSLYHVYRGCGGLLVTSAIHLIEDTGIIGAEPEPTWGLGISYRGDRAGDRQVRRALELFDMIGAEEDNHNPSISRHYWLPVREELRDRECHCKGERTIVEPDGFEWQPNEGNRGGLPIVRTHFGGTDD
jgi:hypothetical protein